MTWSDFTTYISKNIEEYVEEVKDAGNLHKAMTAYFGKNQNPQQSMTNWLKHLGVEVNDVSVEKETSNTSNTSSTTAASAGGSYTGTIQEQFWQFFVADGYSKEAVAGMMGNIEHESHFDPAIIEGGTGWGLGLCQWTNPNGGTTGRRQELEDFLAAKGTDTKDYVAQFEFLKMELDTQTWFGFTGGIAGFKNTSSVYNAVEEFCWKFERPAVATAGMDVRHSAADGYYAQFKDATFSSSSSSSSSSGLARPCSGGSVSSEYGPRILNGYEDNHLGIDIATTGDALAAASGSVLSATWHDSYGNYIVIDHGSIGGENIKTLYAHLSSMALSAGNKVEQGQKIGVIGNTGNSFGVHLHFEVKVNDVRTNPRNYVAF